MGLSSCTEMSGCTEDILHLVRCTSADNWTLISWVKIPKRNHVFRISQTRTFEIIFSITVEMEGAHCICYQKVKNPLAVSLTVGWAAVSCEDPNDCASQELWLSDFSHSSQPHFPMCDTSTVLQSLGIFEPNTVLLLCHWLSGTGICWNHFYPENNQNPREIRFPQFSTPACCVLHPKDLDQQQILEGPSH